MKPATERLFHYQRFVEAHLASLLSDRKVKLSRLDSFNDPWDCRVRFRDPENAGETERLVKYLTELHRKRYPRVTEAERALRAYSFKSDSAKLRGALRQVEKEMYKRMCTQYRVYCLTEKPDSPLMWGHYAGGHTGICLEFDARSAPFTAAQKAQYQSKYLASDLVDVGYESLVTKSEHWSYEAEWRLIAEERASATSPLTVKTDGDFLTLAPGVLKSVTIGCLADSKSRRDITRLVTRRDASVMVRQAEIAPDQYEVRITPAFS